MYKFYNSDNNDMLHWQFKDETSTFLKQRQAK